MKIVHIFIGMLVFSLVCSCSPKIVEHTITRVDSVYVDRFKIDSVYQRDSIFIQEKADTVYHFMERWRDHYVFQKDTVSIVHRDTTVVTEIKEVERQLSTWQNVKIKSFGWLIGLVVGLTGWTFRKQILRLIKLII